MMEDFLGHHLTLIYSQSNLPHLNELNVIFQTKPTGPQTDSTSALSQLNISSISKLDLHFSSQKQSPECKSLNDGSVFQCVWVN